MATIISTGLGNGMISLFCLVMSFTNAAISARVNLLHGKDRARAKREGGSKRGKKAAAAAAAAARVRHLPWPTGSSAVLSRAAAAAATHS